MTSKAKLEDFLKKTDDDRLADDLDKLTLASSKIIYVGIDLGDKSLEIYRRALKLDNKESMLLVEQGAASLVNPGHVTLGYHTDFALPSDFDAFCRLYEENEARSFRITGFCYDKNALAFMVETNRESCFRLPSSIENGDDEEEEKKNDDKKNLVYFPQGKNLHVTSLLYGKTNAYYSNRLIKKCLHYEKLKADVTLNSSSSSSCSSSSPTKSDAKYEYYIKYFDEPIECVGRIMFYR